MRFKKFLMIIVMVSFLGVSFPSAAIPICVGGFLCFWQDPLSAAAGFVLRAVSKKLYNPIYDVHDGLEKIKENIGMYRDQGKCGRSATGNSGCDLSTPEKGEQQKAEMDAEAAVIPDSTIAIIEKSEKGGDIQLDVNNLREDYRDKIKEKTGDTFDKVRANVAKHMFETDDESVNASCQCSAGTGSACSTSECAQDRQNQLLVVASTGASATSDKYLQELDENKRRLEGLVQEINETEKVADFVGKMGGLSVYASSVAAELMALQTYDLRAQSYRNLIFSGVTEVGLPESSKKEDEKK